MVEKLRTMTGDVGGKSKTLTGSVAQLQTIKKDLGRKSKTRKGSVAQLETIKKEMLFEKTLHHNRTCWLPNP